MSFKDILALVDSAPLEAAMLRVASSLATQFDAHLVALHAEPLAYVPVEVGAAFAPSLIEEQERAARRATEAAMLAIDVAARGGRHIERRTVRGDADSVAILHSHYADLVVMGLGSMTASGANAPSVVWENIALGAGRPVLAIPAGFSGEAVGRRIVVAWRPTRESTRALHDAMPFLVRADAVRLMTLNAQTPVGRFVGADIGTHLARHGVKAEVISGESPDASVGPTLLDQAKDFGADLLVAGAYGHTRLREYLLGGTTQYLATHVRVPLMVSH